MNSSALELNFVSSSILHTRQFSWVFLCDSWMIGLLGIISLFYFNQLLGTLISYTYGWYLYKRYNIYFKVQSVKLSFVSCRILFTNLVYIDTSMAVRAVSGTFTWKYWQLKKRKSAIIDDGSTKNNPCPLVLKLSGLEFFLYNHESAYESLKKNFSPEDGNSSQTSLGSTTKKTTHQGSDTSSSSSSSSGSATHQFYSEDDTSSMPTSKRSRSSDSSTTESVDEEDEHSTSYIQEKLAHILPLEIKIRQMGVLIGNESTDSLLTLSSRQCNAEFDYVSKNKGKAPFVSRLMMNFDQPKIEINDNPDYQRSSLTLKEDNIRKRAKFFSRERWHWKWSHKDPPTPWHGLGVYERQANNLDPEVAPGNLRSDEAESIQMEDFHSKSGTFRTSGTAKNVRNRKNAAEVSDDTPSLRSNNDGGSVLDGNNNSASNRNSTSSLENASNETMASERNDENDSPVEYAKVTTIATCDNMELVVFEEDVQVSLKNTKLTYGPWAERKRQGHMAAFLPTNTSPAEPWNLRIGFHMTGHTELIIPIREISKDETVRSGADITRNYGWFDMSTSTDMGVSLDFAPTQSNAFSSELGNIFADKILPEDKAVMQMGISIVMADVEIRSSVNHETFLTAARHKMNILLQKPAIFNAKHYMTTCIESQNLDVFLLREHGNLIFDAISDFSDGHKEPYALFIPVIYSMNWEIADMSLYMNVNKGNIINNPTSVDENTFIKFVAPTATAKTCNPRIEITSPFVNSFLDFEIPSLSAELNAPNWHTLNAFLDTNKLAHVNDFLLSFKSFESNGRRSNRKVIDVLGTDLQLLAHGATIAYFYRIIENYFGEFRSFQTTAEFNQQDWELAPPASDFSRQTNEDDVLLNIKVRETAWRIPVKMYSTKDAIVLESSEINIDTRFTNYYMDLQAYVAPISVSYSCNGSSDTKVDTHLLRIMGIDVHAHRMFGLPPLEPTYAVQWTFDIGKIVGRIEAPYCTLIGRALRAQKHAYADDENRPVFALTPASDIAFFRVTVGKIEMTIFTAETDILISTDKISLFYSDLPSESFESKLTLNVPDIVIRMHTNGGKLLAFCEVSLSASSYSNPKDWREHSIRRRRFVAKHDALFHRTACLLDKTLRSKYPYTRVRQPGDIKSLRPLPIFPYPLSRYENPHLTSASSSSGSSHSQSTFESSDDDESIYVSKSPLFVDQHEDADLSCTVVELSNFSVDLHPEFFLYLNHLETALSPALDTDAESLLDDVQEWVVDNNRMTAQQTMRRVHIYIPTITMNLNNIVLEVTEIHLMKHLQDSQYSFNFAFEYLRLSFETDDDVLAFSFDLRKLSLIWQHTAEDEGVVSFNLEDVDCNLIAGKTGFIVEEIGKLVDSVQSFQMPATENEADGNSSQQTKKPSQDLQTQELFLQLTDASDELSVEQDTYVLSRPSGGVQSPTHIRGTLNWRAVMRLRFLLQKLPKWKITEIVAKVRSPVQASVENNDKNLQRVLNAFRRWRSWEHTDMEVLDATLFKHVFLKKTLLESLLSTRAYLSAGINFFGIKIEGNDSEILSLILEECCADLDATQTIGATVRFSRSLARADIQLVPFIADTLKKIESRFPGKDRQKKDIPSSKKIEKSQTLPRDVQILLRRLHNATFSVFLLDVAIIQNLGVLNIETQNHQVQFTSLFQRNAENNSLAHTGTLATSTGAFRVFTPEGVDVLDSLLRSVHLGYTYRQAEQNKNNLSSLFSSLMIQSASLVSHLPATELAELTLKFLQVTVPLLKNASDTIPERFRDFSKRSPNEDDSGKDGSSESSTVDGVTSSHFINIDIASLKTKARLVDDLNFVSQGKQFSAKIRHSRFIIGSFEIQNAGLAVKHGDNGTLGSVQLEKIRALLRSFPKDIEPLLFTRINSIKMETMSLLWLFEYAARRRVQDHVTQFTATLSNCIELLHKYSGNNSTLGSASMKSDDKDTGPKSTPSAKNMKLRVTNHTNEIVAIIPIDTSSLDFRINRLSLQLKDREASTTIDSFNVLLKSSRSRIPREVFSLHLAVYLSHDAESNSDILDVESNHMKLAIDPDTIIALTAAAKRFRDNAQASSHRSRSSSRAMSTHSAPGSPISGTLNLLNPLVSPNKSPAVINSESNFKVEDLRKFRVFLKLCMISFTYFTSTNSQEGIVIGFDLLELRMFELLAKLKVTTMYIAPVDQGHFRATLPMLEANMCVSTDPKDAKSTKKSKDTSLDCNVQGKAFIIHVEPSAARWFMVLIRSIEQAYLAIKPPGSTGFRRPASTASLASLTNMANRNTDTHKSATNGINIPVNMGFFMQFDGGVVELNDESNNPAMELKSPSVIVTAELGDDRVAVRIDLSTTKNEVFPKAVNEIKSFISNIRRYNAFTTVPTSSVPASPLMPASPDPLPQFPKMAHQTEVSDSSPPIQPALSLDTTSQKQSAMRFFGLKFDLLVHFGKQELYLSSLPYGKVGALLSANGFDIIVSGNENLYAVAKLNELKVSLQHIHSREVSAMVSVDKTILDGLFETNRPPKVCLNVHKPEITANLGKLHEMRLFLDIWNIYDPPSSEEASKPPVNIVIPVSPRSQTSNSSNALSLMTSSAFAYIVNVVISDSKFNIALGPSIGNARLELDKSWIVVFADEKGGLTMDLKMSLMEILFEGRLGGLLRLENVEGTLAQHENKKLTHYSLHTEYFGGYLSLDYHVFLTLSTIGVYLVHITQDPAVVGDDRVHAAIKCSTINIASTELVGIHILEIFQLFKRLQNQITSAASFIASKDAGSKEIADENLRRNAKKRSARSTKHSETSRVVLDIRLGELIVHAFPTDLGNTNALKLFISRAEIHYDETKTFEYLVSSLDLGLDECLICMANVKKNPYVPSGVHSANSPVASSTSKFEYRKYLEYLITSSSGGTIVNLPELTLSMDTREARDSRRKPIEYGFSNQFHGSIEVGWNLGSVSFIKEMLKTHQDALKANHINLNLDYGDDDHDDDDHDDEKGANNDANKTNYDDEKSLAESESSVQLHRTKTSESYTSTSSSAVTTSDPNILFGRRYVATSPPIIMIPQLRDLGDATPPIEWLGVNRERLPLFVHAIITRKLQKIASCVEMKNSD